LKEIKNENIYVLNKLTYDFNNNLNDNYMINQLLMTELNISVENYDYFYKLKDFIDFYFKDNEKFKNNKNYNEIYLDIINNAKLEFRYFCYRYIDYICQIPIKNI
jgi:hypothetical protein